MSISEEDIKNMNIYQKLARVRKLVEVIKKDTRGFGYTYAKEEAILAKVTTQIDKYHLSLIPGIVPGTTQVNPYHYTKTKVTKNGEVYEEHSNDILVSADMTWTWVNNDDPEDRIVVPWAIVGQQSDASQSFGSGLTYSSRYFLLKYFNISTSDEDPDEFRRKQKATEVEAEKMVNDEIVKSIDQFVRSFMSRYPKRGADVRKIVEKYVPTGDYFKIKESSLSGKLLRELDETFKSEMEEN